MKVIIAHFKEELGWIKRLPPDCEPVVIEKEKFMPNKGKDIATHLLYILSNWTKLEGEYLFCQDDPFYHHPWFIEDIKTHVYFGWTWVRKDYAFWRKSTPRSMKEVCERLDLWQPDHFVFRQGCQFRATAEQLHQCRYERLAEAFALSVMDGWEGPNRVEFCYPMLFPHLIGELSHRQSSPSRRVDQPMRYPEPEMIAQLERAVCSHVSDARLGASSPLPLVVG